MWIIVDRVKCTSVRDLYQDVQRRDFTVNAIAMDSNYKTYDYFEGERDLKRTADSYSR